MLGQAVQKGIDSIVKIGGFVLLVAAAPLLAVPAILIWMLLPTGRTVRREKV